LADSVACGSSTSMDDDDAGMMPPPPPKTQAGKREKPAAKKRKRDNDELTESAKARKKAAEPTTQEVDNSGDTLAVDARLQVDALQGSVNKSSKNGGKGQKGGKEKPKLKGLEKRRQQRAEIQGMNKKNEFYRDTDTKNRRKSRNNNT